MDYSRYISILLFIFNYNNQSTALNIFCSISSSGWQANDTCTFSNVITTDSTKLQVQAPTENVNRAVFKTSALKKIPIEVLKHFPSLFALDLENNDISDIEGSVFVNAGNLKELYLGQNKIKKLKSGTFALTPKMEWLWMQNNRIDYIDEDAFDDLENLTWLRLEQNRISYFPKRMFENMHNLQRVDLSFNELQEIDYRNMKITLPNLIEIGIEGNAMSCGELPQIINGLRRQTIKLINFNDNGATDERQVNGISCIPADEFVKKAIPVSTGQTQNRQGQEEGVEDEETEYMPQTISKQSRPTSNDRCCSKVEKQITDMEAKYLRIIDGQKDVIAEMDARISSILDQTLDLQDQVDNMNVVIKRLQNQVRRNRN